jgi:hypothetical protein
MDGWIPHLLAKLDVAHDLLRDIKEAQSEHLEILERIESKPGCEGHVSDFDWQKFLPTVIWVIVLLGLAIIQIPLKDAVTIATRISGAG